jgi:hypothetical protein
MTELHTAGRWYSEVSTEDYQGHFIVSDIGKTVAATIIEDSCDCTKEEFANGSLIVAAPALLKALRQIARDADSRQDDGAMELGERLIGIERAAKAAITLYEAPIAGWKPNQKDDADE